MIRINGHIIVQVNEFWHGWRDMRKASLRDESGWILGVHDERENNKH